MNTINKALQSTCIMFLRILFLGTGILPIISCEKDLSNRPCPIDLEPRARELARVGTIVNLEDLSAASDDTQWEQFFNQRGGINCWKQIYMTPDNIDKHLEVSFDELKDASMLIDAQDRTDQVTAGIIHCEIVTACPIYTEYTEE